jgi:Putative zinc-finger
MKRMSHLDSIVIAEWANGRLSPQEKMDVEAHLAACGKCRAEADFASDHFRVEAGRDLGETSDRLRQSFRAKLDASLESGHGDEGDRRRTIPRGPAPRGRRTMSWWLAAAAIAFAGIGIQQMSKTDGPPIPSGEVRSLESERANSLEVVKTDDGWTIRGSSTDTVTSIRLSVETIDGSVVYQRSGESLEWIISAAELAARGDGDLYFVRLSGTDEAGRTWRTRAELLP